MDNILLPLPRISGVARIFKQRGGGGGQREGAGKGVVSPSHGREIYENLCFFFFFAH